MIYPFDFESKIGFESIRKSVLSLCNTRLGKDEVSGMTFSSDFNEVRKRLVSVKEMTEIISSNLPYPVGAMHDIVPELQTLRVRDSFLSSDMLHKLNTSLHSIEEVKNFFNTKEEGDSSSNHFPELNNEFGDITCFPGLISQIENIINRYGEVKDTASENLYEIRKALRQSSGSMQRVMKHVMEDAMVKGILERDVTPSIRDGRLVIPVVSGKKYSLNGIIHDESATGKTVYIEPAEVVEVGNRIRQLEMEEHREIRLILIKIADIIRPFIDDIIESCHKMARLDFIRAKALYAISIDAQMPVLSKNEELEWYHAIHPSLLVALKQQGREVVPLNITLNKEHRILIISGPNAGGKSICLKTIAVVQYMMQCGLLPSLYYNSHMGIFRNIFIDIGDEQSLENDLSTYSSHLKNMKYFLKNSDKHTIILADEMGSGTEPGIGGAMAQSILKFLASTDCLGVITTHYQNLKSFAETEPGFINGAMSYDRQHLQPTFELVVGTPGSSFALDIARKIGLPDKVIEDAKEIVGSDYINIDKYVSEITRDRRYWANKRLQIKEKENKLDSLLQQYEETAEDLKSKRKQILNEAQKEAKEILAGANAKIERTILDIRKSQAEKEKTKRIRKNLEEYRKELDDKSAVNPVLPDSLKPLKHKSKKAGKVEDKKNNNESPELRIGDFVKIKDGSGVGEIISISGKNVEVAFGNLRTSIKADKLIKARKPKDSIKNELQSMSVSTSEDIRKRQLNFSNEIDVRGMRTDEALQAVTYFLDDSIQFAASKVRILHGTGHGILKTMIRQLLKSNSAVADFHDEDVRFGGAGITVVNLV